MCGRIASSDEERRVSPQVVHHLRIERFSAIPGRDGAAGAALALVVALTTSGARHDWADAAASWLVGAVGLTLIHLVLRRRRSGQAAPKGHQQA